MRMVNTSTAIITGNAPTIILWIRSGILWLGEKTMTNENRYKESGITHKSGIGVRSEEHTSELQSRQYLVCRLLLEKKKKKEDCRTTAKLLSHCNMSSP